MNAIESVSIRQERASLPSPIVSRGVVYES